MIRYNYYQPPFERWFGRSAGTLIDGDSRQSLLAIGAALILIATLWFIEGRRIAAVDAQLADVRLRSAAAAQTAERVGSFEHMVASLRERRRNVIAGRVEALEQANQIARIGNHLPEQTWLNTLRTDDSGSWLLNGRSTRLMEIGTTLRTLHDLDRNASPRLLSVATDPRHERMLDFAIALDRRK